MQESFTSCASVPELVGRNFPHLGNGRAAVLALFWGRDGGKGSLDDSGSSAPRGKWPPYSRRVANAARRRSVELIGDLLAQQPLEPFVLVQIVLALGDGEAVRFGDGIQHAPHTGQRVSFGRFQCVLTSGRLGLTHPPLLTTVLIAPLSLLIEMVLEVTLDQHLVDEALKGWTKAARVFGSCFVGVLRVLRWFFRREQWFRLLLSQLTDKLVVHLPELGAELIQQHHIVALILTRFLGRHRLPH
uniref:Uncharacterized protein n=1 Tax=Anopheles farauti TaxID=69004 RepID=A0A182QQL1_9DIPT